jgi:hypothetical protein
MYRYVFLHPHTVIVIVINAHVRMYDRTIIIVAENEKCNGSERRLYVPPSCLCV